MAIPSKTRLFYFRRPSRWSLYIVSIVHIQYAFCLCVCNQIALIRRIERSIKRTSCTDLMWTHTHTTTQVLFRVVSLFSQFHLRFFYLAWKICMHVCIEDSSRKLRCLYTKIDLTHRGVGKVVITTTYCSLFLLLCFWLLHSWHNMMCCIHWNECI